MTYRTLLKQLQSLPPERLDDSATLLINDEWHQIDGFGISDQSNDVLDEGHFYLEVYEDDQEPKPHVFVDCGGYPRCSVCGCDEDDAFVGGMECLSHR